MLLTVTSKLKTTAAVGSLARSSRAVLSYAQVQEILNSSAHWRVKRLAGLLDAGQPGAFQLEGDVFVVDDDAGAASTEFVSSTGARCSVGIDENGVSFRKHAPPGAPLGDDVFTMIAGYDEPDFIDRLEDLKGEME